MEIRETWERDPMVFIETFQTMTNQIYEDSGGSLAQIDERLMLSSVKQAICLLSFPFSGKKELTADEILNLSEEISHKLTLFHKTGSIEF